MQAQFDQFYNLYNGKSVEVEDPTNKYQCFDLAFAWCDFLKIPRSAIRHLYAYQIWTQPSAETKKYFDMIPNGPTNVPQVGDIVVFSTTVGYAGHVSIAKNNSTSMNLSSFDQNWSGKQYATSIIHYNYYGVLGWLRPKSASEPVTDAQKLVKIKEIAHGPGSGDEKVDRIKLVL